MHKKQILGAGHLCERKVRILKATNLIWNISEQLVGRYEEVKKISVHIQCKYVYI